MMVWRNRSCTALQQGKFTQAKRTSALIAGLSLLVVPLLAARVAAAADTSASASAPVGLEEIVITARRKSELLQDVVVPCLLALGKPEADVLRDRRADVLKLSARRRQIATRMPAQ